MNEATAAIIGGVVGALVGPFAAWGLELADRRRQRAEVSAALRFELASNLLWLDQVLDSLNYLRDEAWVAMKNRGYISYLKAPLPLLVARAYDRMHALNGRIRDTREARAANRPQANELRGAIEEVRLATANLIGRFDKIYPRMAKNFVAPVPSNTASSSEFPEVAA